MFTLLAIVALVPGAFAAEVVSDATVGDYTVRILSDSLEVMDVLEISKCGEVILTRDDCVRFWIGDAFNPAYRGVGAGRDVSGDGVPDVVVTGWSGGAHCCFTTWVYSVGPDLKLLAEIEAGHSEPRFLNADEDSALEVQVVDWTFAYFPGSFGGSPAPKVILDWRGDSLVVSPSLTAQPRPAREELLDRARAVRESPRWQEPAQYPYSDIFPPAVDLMYAGHEDLGWLYLRESWGASEEERLRLEQVLRELLDSSMYYRELAAAYGDSDGRRGE
jgi:hypothetical protein